mmetsp:Transcript_30187/g.46217  ORF Transcript_30187/g.46217 Transcript_30187/m.46217 type:complete len:181 (+) Transcript_30187:63-605(+)
MRTTINHAQTSVDDSVDGTTTVRRSRGQNIGIFLIVLPVVILMLKLIVDQITSLMGINEGFGMDWPRWLYFVLAGLSGALGGGMHAWCATPKICDIMSIPYVLGGAAVSVGFLACEDLISMRSNTATSRFIFQAFVVVPGLVVFHASKHILGARGDASVRSETQVASYGAVSGTEAIETA